MMSSSIPRELSIAPSTGRTHGVRVLAIALFAVLASLAAAGAASAGAATGPALRVTSMIPDYVTPGGALEMFVAVQDVGDEPLSGNLTVKYTFPPGVEVTSPAQRRYGMQCTAAGQVDECVVEVTGVPVDGELLFITSTTVQAGASGLLAGQVEVSGGGAPNTVTEPIAMHAEPIGPFAIKGLGVDLAGQPGSTPDRAGSVPAEAVTNVSLLSAMSSVFVPQFTIIAPPESFRDVVVHAPRGFVGYPTATPVRCAPSQLTTATVGAIPQCPLASQIGVVRLLGHAIVPLYNMQPPAGSPAAFGFNFVNVPVTLLAKVRPDGGIDIDTVKAPDPIPIPNVEVALWGAPADSSHDPLRGVCQAFEQGNFNGENCPAQAAPAPFLRMPTSCTGQPLPWSVEIDTYQRPGTWLSKEATTPAVQECEKEPFAPRFSLAPSVLAPHAASGADVTLSMPQEATLQSPFEADLKSAAVTLPAGLTLNPAAANGLAACPDEQLRLGKEGRSECPDASKVGTVTVKTPLLDHEVGGSVFLRTQNSTEPASGEMFRVAIEVRSDNDGVDLKIPGMVKVDPNTGQVTTVFDDLPQLPFDSMTLHFTGGAHPTLVTPDGCGSYSTASSMTGWNGKTAQEAMSFVLARDCAGRGFAPVFTAGTQNAVAGAFAPFALQVTRTDNDQELSSLSSLTLPKGLLADIGSVPRCTDSQVAVAACPDSTRLGNVTVGSGAGATPVYITDGNVYLTGPYKGAPFGLVFVIHAQAGPFDFGMVVVRAALNIDPHTAQARIETDPLPSIVKGVPVRLRDLRVSIDRPHFTLNPTNCQTMAVNGKAKSTQGASAPLTSRFQVGECRSLNFKPKFAASTSGKSSRKEGASLHVVIKSASGQANIAKVDVQVPKALSVRDSTLNHACTEAQFAANPAGCPAGSFVGTATAHTPILGKPLVGPAIFVSHGGAKFPDLDIVLQGEGVTIVLTGNTFVTKGRLLSRFETVPDAPVSRFDLTMPRGPHSALAANGSLCASTPARLVMPTTIVGQNGAVVHRSTKLSVSGCAKHKARHKKHPRK